MYNKKIATSKEGTIEGNSKEGKQSGMGISHGKRENLRYSVDYTDYNEV